MPETWKQYMERLMNTPGYIKIPPAPASTSKPKSLKKQKPAK